MKSLPHFQCKNGVPQFLVNEEPVLLLSGQLHNSSSSSEEYMKAVWPKLKAMHMNTVIATASWELIEPEPGTFTFESVDHLIEQARRYGLKLLIIWFASWKNGSSTYIPAWAKRDRKTYFRCRTADGRVTGTISPLCKACVEADARAFSRLMRHLKEIDGEEQTVLAMQVENESGFYGGDFDWSEPSVKAFSEPVPEELIQYLNRASLVSPLAEHYTQNGASWEAAFGEMAHECFMAYHFAKSIGYVAARGKEEYPLPMYANIWPMQYPGEFAALRPCGGPDSSVYPIWKQAAPALDALAPDLYEENFVEECARYKQGGTNSLIISELRYDRWAPAMVLYALSQGALLVSPFGIDDIDRRPEKQVPDMVQGVHQTMSPHDSTDFLKKLYAQLGGLEKTIIAAAQRGDLFGVMQGNLVQEGLNMGEYHLRVTFPRIAEPQRYPGALMVIREAEGSFILVGFSVQLEFFSKKGRQIEWISLDEGSFETGRWVPGRRLNGDELRLDMGEEVTVWRLSLESF